MAGDKTYITDDQGKLHRATRVHAVTPTDIVWSSNPNDYTVQVKIDGKWHRAVLTMDAGSSTFFDNINIDKALVTGADGKQHTALIVKPESTVTLSDIKTDTHGTIAGTTTGETAVSTYSENWSNVKWQDNVNVYKVLVTGSDGKVHTALLTTSVGGGVQVIVLGTSPLLLPDAIADSLTYVKAFGGTEQRNLPDGYTQQQFIYMLDNSCLLTDIVPTYDGKVEFDFQTTTIQSTSMSLLGGRTIVYGGLYLVKGGGGNFIVDAFSTSSAGRYTSTVSPVANTRYKFTYDNQVVTLESEGSVLFTNTMTGTSENGAALVLNGLNDNGTTYAGTRGIYVYSFKAWDNQGNLIANYVPAIETGETPVVGFYDTVSGTFKTATRGTFAAGGAVPTPDVPIDIISNNGILKVSPNLFNKATVSKYTLINTTTGNTMPQPNEWSWCSDFIPVSPSTTYFFKSGTDYPVRMFEYDENKSYLSRNYTIQNTFFTVGSTCKFIRFHIGTTAGGQAMYEGETMVSLGSTALPYKPYGVYADGTVETINAHGKNWFDDANADWVIGSYIDTNGVIRYNSGYRRTQTMMRIEPSTEYTLSYVKETAALSSCFFALYDANENFIATIVPTTDSTSGLKSGTFTTPANAKYYTVSVIVSSRDMQIEKGSTATEYESYFNGGTATAEMLLKVGDYQDVQSILDGIVTRNVGVKILNGTENFETATAINCYSLTNTLGTGNFADRTIVCSHFASTPTLPDTSDRQGLAFIVNKGPEYTIAFGATTQFSTQALWQQFLADQYAAGTPVIVLYPLATPTTESVTGQPLQVTDGDNVLEITQASLSDLELEAKYTKVA